MSIEIFKLAKFRADKIIEIVRLHTLCKNRLEKSSIDIKSYSFYSNSVMVNTGNYVRSVIRFGDQKYNIRDYYKFDGTGTDYRHNTINRRLQPIAEFDEATDFQLMTIFSDKELLDYYFCSLIYNAGFIGYIRHDIHHNTLNTMIKYLNKIYEYKDSELYQHTRIIWK